MFRVSRVLSPYLPLVSSRELFWLLSMELFLSRSLLRELSRDPVSIVRHVTVVSLKRPDEFVENGSVFCQRVICHVIRTSRRFCPSNSR